jgi:hypothetical protein
MPGPGTDDFTNGFKLLQIDPLPRLRVSLIAQGFDSALAKLIAQY